MTQLNSWKRSLNVDVPADGFKSQEEKAILEFQKKVHVDGFRKGKVPLNLIRQRFSGEMKDDVSEKLAIHFLRIALEEKNLFPIATPVIRKLDYAEGVSLHFSAEMEVEPDVQVADYKGLKLEKEIVKITKEDVRDTIQAMREERATRKSVETGAASGHIVEGDIQALESTGIPVIGQKWENRGIELGVSTFGKIVEGQLQGIKAGEERRFRVIEPVQGADGTVREQEKHYSIKVKSVSEKVLPELADDFAKAAGNFESVIKMEEGIQKYLESRRDEEAEKQLEDRIASEVVRRNDIELPPSMIENALSALFEDQQRRSERRVDPGEFRKVYLPVVQRSLKWDLLWHKIAEVESLAVAESEAEQAIQNFIQASPKDEKRVRALYKDAKRMHDLKDRLLNEKVMALIKQHAKIKEATIHRPSQAASGILTP